MTRAVADRASLASLWTAAMSNPGATQLKALSAVLGENISIGGQQGKDGVLAWIRTWPGRSMIRTGAWGEPAVAGDEVTVTCMFDAKAAYYSGTLTLTIPETGLITKAALLVLAAPEPLGHVVSRVWGARRGLDRLPAHLSDTYGVEVDKVTPLDNGVLRVDHDAGRWVVRVFPEDRHIAEVEGDAAVLEFLEERDYPAERCLADVSCFEGQGVLVTSFVEGKMAQATARTVAAMADLLGRLHALSGGPRSVKRASGGLHLYSPETTLRSELDTALACLAAATFRGTDSKHTALVDALHAADDFSALPAALTHPDFHVRNTIATRDGLVLIDWAGAGTGPRVLALGMLLFYGSLVPKGFDLRRVDAMVDAYTAHVALTTPELDRLAEAMQHRMLIHEAYGWAVGMATRRKPGSRGEWPDNNALCHAIAERASGRVAQGR